MKYKLPCVSNHEFAINFVKIKNLNKVTMFQISDSFHNHSIIRRFYSTANMFKNPKIVFCKEFKEGLFAHINGKPIYIVDNLKDNEVRCFY